jgi:hypothetical protein
VAPNRLAHGQRQASRLQELDALVPEPQYVHRILRVVAELLDELGTVHVALAPLPNEAFALRFKIAEESPAGLSRRERRRELLELPSDLGPDDERIVWQVQEQEHGRIALERQARPFPQTVDGQIQIAGSRSRLRRVPRARRRIGTPLLELAEADDEAAWFQADAHFVAIVGAVEHQAMYARADESARMVFGSAIDLNKA